MPHKHIAEKSKNISSVGRPIFDGQKSPFNLGVETCRYGNSDQLPAKSSHVEDEIFGYESDSESEGPSTLEKNVREIVHRYMNVAPVAARTVSFTPEKESPPSTIGKAVEHQIITGRSGSPKNSNERKVKIKRISTRGIVDCSKRDPDNRIREKPPSCDPMFCERKPYYFLSAEPVEKGVHKSSEKPLPIPRRPRNPGFIPNRFANMGSNARCNTKFKLIFHPHLGIMINSEHPDYFKLRKKKRKISPNVGLRMQSCAVFAKGALGPYDNVDKEEDKEDEKQEPTKRSASTNLSRELIARAPKFLTKAALKYLQSDWEDESKLPENIRRLVKDNYVVMQEKLFRLKYLIQFWDIGPETKVQSSWIKKRAMLAFTGDELSRGITKQLDFGGLTDILRTAISLSKGVFRECRHKLWEEHDVSNMAKVLVTGNEDLKTFADNVKYDDVSTKLKLSLLKLVDCEMKQSISWWERGTHLVYGYFIWPEGWNKGSYHTIFNYRTGKLV